jgi:hypothetical protein
MLEIAKDNYENSFHHPDARFFNIGVLRRLQAKNKGQ